MQLRLYFQRFIANFRGSDDGIIVIQMIGTSAVSESTNFSC